MIERKCACGAVFLAKEADVKRGWAKSCSKSCAATKREKRTGTFQAYIQRQERQQHAPRYPTFDNAHQFDNCEQGGDE